MTPHSRPRSVPRHGPPLALAAAALLLLALPVSPGARAGQYLLRWLPPADPDIAGYNAYLGRSSKHYDVSISIGLHRPGADGVASYAITLPEEGRDYFLALTAYDTSGNESAFSNEVFIQMLDQETPLDELLDLMECLDVAVLTLRESADSRLDRKLEKLGDLVHKTRLGITTDKRPIQSALKNLKKVIRKLASVRKYGADPAEVDAAERATLEVMRRVAQGEVASVACGEDKSCIRKLTRSSKKIIKGDTSRTKGRRSPAAGYYAAAYISASKL